jgi:hypothetical protein
VPKALTEGSGDSDALVKLLSSLTSGLGARDRWSRSAGFIGLALSGALTLLAGCAHSPGAGNFSVRRPQVASVELAGSVTPREQGECAKNEFLQSMVPQISTELVKTERVHRFFDPVPSTIARGVDSLQVSGATLTIFTLAQGRFDEFQGPVSETVESARYEASPGVAVLAHTVTLGLGLLFAPVKSAQHAFGCTDRRVIRREVRAEHSVPTGGLQWRDVPAQLLLRVEGIGPPRDLNFNHLPGEARSVSVSLLDAVVDHRVDGPVTLLVRCLNCERAAVGAPEAMPSFRSELTLNADFGAVRSAELARRAEAAEAVRLARLARELEAQALTRVRGALIGRWGSHELCVQSERDDLGVYYETDPGGWIRARTVFLDANRSFVRSTASRVELSVVDIEREIFRAQYASTPVGSRVPVNRRFDFKIDAGVMTLLNLTEGSREHIRDGKRTSDGQPGSLLYNCAHETLLNERAESIRIKEAQARQAEALRVQQEREAAERRRLEEEQRRILEERRRRQEI